MVLLYVPIPFISLSFYVNRIQIGVYHSMELPSGTRVVLSMLLTYSTKRILFFSLWRRGSWDLLSLLATPSSSNLQR